MAVNKLTKAVAVTILALWGLAAMHCELEVLPGLDFLESCCFADSTSSSPKDCESDGCCAVEKGFYLAEKQSASARQPLLIVALLSPVMDAPLPEFPGIRFSEAQAPPELRRIWQFSCRTALQPRAPSLVS
jgi:hypothetical protein